MPTHPTDHEALRRYLLGERPEPETERLERRLLEEADLSELALAIEEELIEDSVRGDLSREQCASLLTRLAASPAGQERIAFQRALGKVVREQPKHLPEPLPFPTRLRRAAARRPRLAASLAAGLAAAVLVCVILPTSPQLPPGMDAIVKRDLELSSDRSVAAPKKFVPIDHPAQRIELTVDFEGRETFPSFRAIVTSAVSGEEILLDDLPPAEGGWAVVLPLPRLAEGTYLVRVEGVQAPGEQETIGNTKIEVVVQ